MNEDMAQRLHRLLAKFVTEGEINPTNIKINFSPNKALIVLEILPKASDSERKLVD